MYGNREERLGEGLKSKMYDLKPGERLAVSKTIKGKKKGYTCTVIKEHERFITVDKGNYRSTVDKLSIQQGEIKVTRLS